VQWGTAWRTKLQAALVIVVGAGCLVASLVIVYFGFRDTGLISAYRSASSCASPTDALSTEACRYAGKATVLSTSRHDLLEVRVSFDSLPGRTFSTGWPRDGEPDTSALNVGGSAPGELWNGHVTRLAGQPTIDDPEGYPTTSFFEIGGFIGLLSLGAVVSGAFMARAAWRRK
jgi:hypothetical protein